MAALAKERVCCDTTKIRLRETSKLHRASRRLRIVAAFEGAKGIIVLGAGLGAFELIHRDVQLIAEAFVQHFHLNPARGYPRIFTQLAGDATPQNLLLIALGAVMYALFRFVEAFGLWRGRSWAEWLGVVSSGLYLPLEFWDLMKGITWPRVTLLAVNLLVMSLLARALFTCCDKESHKDPSAAPRGGSK